MIKDYDEIKKLFIKINKQIDKSINIYVIGGAVLLYQELKPATKDIELIVNTQQEFLSLQKTLLDLGFKPKIPGIEYSRLNLSQIYQKDDFRIDLFHKTVCGKFSLSKNMIIKSEKILKLSKITINHCSNEDIFLFKTMTQREGDLTDCISLAKIGLNWKNILEELENQISENKKDIWITWVGERLDILQEKGLIIPIMKDINKQRKKLFEE